MASSPLLPEAPRSWISKRAKIDSWSPPLPDADIEAELNKVLKLPIGPEAATEARLIEEFHKPRRLIQPSSARDYIAPGDTNASPRSIRFLKDQRTNLAAPSLLSLLLRLPLLANIADHVAGLSPALATLAAISSRWFCACHLVRLAACTRCLKVLDRALRFGAHHDFRRAAIQVDNVDIELEVAKDFIELDAAELRNLMAIRGENSNSIGANAKTAPLAAKASVVVLYEMLIAGRPGLADIGCNTGIWPQDRRLLDPAMILPLMLQFQRDGMSREARKRLRSVLCRQMHQLTPAAVLDLASDANKDETFKDANKVEDVESWRIAAAAVLQWAWVQVAYEELETHSVAHLGPLEKALLLQPVLATRRIQRSRDAVFRKLETLRADGLLLRLLCAPLEGQVSTRVVVRTLARAASQPGRRVDKMVQPQRLASGRAQKSLPSLQGTHIGPSGPPKLKVERSPVFAPTWNEQKRYIVGDGSLVPSFSVHATSASVPNNLASTATPGRIKRRLITDATNHACPRDGHSAERRSRIGTQADVDESRQRTCSAVPRGPALKSGEPTHASLREALGFPAKECLVATAVVGDVPTKTPIDATPHSLHNSQCATDWRRWRRPCSAPAALPWASPGLRFCTPLRA